MATLLIDVAFEPRDGQGERIQCEREIVGFVGKGSSKRVLDAAR